MVLLQRKLYFSKDPDPLSPPLRILTCTYFINIWAQTAFRQLDFQILAQDFQIKEGGSQDFLIQNVSGSTVAEWHLLSVNILGLGFDLI